MEAAANQPSAQKITLGNILGMEGKDVYNPPYDKASFEKYLIEEHTSENIEFWNAAQSYKKYATRYYPPLIHRTFHSSFVQLKNALSKGKLQENRSTSRISPKTSKSASEGGLSGSKNALSPSAQEGGRTGERRSLNASEGRSLGSPSALSLSAQEGGVTAERQSLSTTPSVSEGRLSPSADKGATDGGNKIKAKGEGEASVETDEGNKELTDEVMAKLKEAMGEIIKSFLTPGSKKEINVNDNVRKKATARYEQGDYSPEVLRPAADKAFEMMKVQSLGRYLAHCQTKGAVPRKASLVAGPDRSTAKTKKDKEKCVVS